jgi:hypothetical protein
MNNNTDRLNIQEELPFRLLIVEDVGILSMCEPLGYLLGGTRVGLLQLSPSSTCYLTSGFFTILSMCEPLPRFLHRRSRGVALAHVLA